MSKTFSIVISQGVACSDIESKLPDVSSADISKVLNALEHVIIDAGGSLIIDYGTRRLHVVVRETK